MQRRSVHFVWLVVGVFSASSCSESDQPTPSVRDALLKAIEHTKTEDLFSNESVEIAASKQTDGSVKVLFSVPTSSVIVADGRLATKLLTEVRVTTKDVVSKHHGKSEEKRSKGQTSAAKSEALSQAAAAVCVDFSESDPMEFAIKVSEDGEGFSVLFQCVPYMPGGHTLYKVSNKFKVLDTIGGL